MNITTKYSYEKMKNTNRVFLFVCALVYYLGYLGAFHANAQPAPSGTNIVNITVSTNVVNVGQSFVVQWTFNGTNSPIAGYDWIAVYDASEPNTIVGIKALAYIAAGTPGGVNSFVLNEPRLIDVRYVRWIRSNTFQTLAKSQTITVRDAVQLFVNPLLIAERGSVEVKWDTGNRFPRDDEFIVIYTNGLPTIITGQVAIAWTEADPILAGYKKTFRMDQEGTFVVRYVRWIGGNDTSARFRTLAESPIITVVPLRPNPNDIVNHGTFQAGRSNIVLFGDSLVANLNVNPEYALASATERWLMWTRQKEGETRTYFPVIGAGASGDTTEDALFRIGEDVEPWNPALVVIVLSGNDCFQFVPIGDTVQNMENIVRIIQNDIGAMVALAGIGGAFGFCDYEDEFAEIAANMGAAFIPGLLQDVITDPKKVGGDLHPNAYGILDMAELIVDVTGPLLDPAGSGGGGPGTPALAFADMKPEDGSKKPNAPPDIGIPTTPRLNPRLALMGREGNSLTFGAIVDGNRHYVLETSTDLTHWKPLVRVTGSGSVTFEVAAQQQDEPGFFRLVEEAGGQ